MEWLQRRRKKQIPPRDTTRDANAARRLPEKPEDSAGMTTNGKEPAGPISGLRWSPSDSKNRRRRPYNGQDYFPSGRSVTGFLPVPGSGDFAPPADSPASSALRFG